MLNVVDKPVWEGYVQGEGDGLAMDGAEFAKEIERGDFGAVVVALVN